MTDIHVQVVPRADARRGDLTGRSLTENLRNRVDELGDSIVDVARGLRTRLTRAEPPDGSAWGMAEVQVTFSLDLQAEAGVIVSRTSAGASFEVSITWSRGGVPTPDVPVERNSFAGTR